MPRRSYDLRTGLCAPAILRRIGSGVPLGYFDLLPEQLGARGALVDVLQSLCGRSCMPSFEVEVLASEAYFLGSHCFSRRSGCRNPAKRDAIRDWPRTIFIVKVRNFLDWTVPGELDVWMMRLIPAPILVSPVMEEGSASYGDAPHSDCGVTVGLLLSILDHPDRATVVADTLSGKAI